MKNKKGKLMRFEHNSSNKTEVQAQPVEQKEKEEQKEQKEQEVVGVSEETQEPVKEEVKEEEVKEEAKEVKEDANSIARKILVSSNIFLRCLELSTYDKITVTSCKSISAKSLKKLMDVYGMQSLKVNEDGSITLFFPQGTFDKHS